MPFKGEMRLGGQPDIEVSTQTPVFQEVLDFLTTQEYRDSLRGKNLASEDLERVYGLLDSREGLAVRAEELMEKSLTRLADFYGEDGDIVIPFSGGRDSSAMAILTLGMFDQDTNRRVVLATALNGFSRQIENPRLQARMIDKRLGFSKYDPERDHLYFDLSEMNHKVIIESAQEDRDRLGFPAFCSACKVGIEHTMATFASEEGYKHIVMGYNDYQARQLWPEQSPAQIQATREHFEVLYPDLHIGSPLHDVIDTPVDGPLILGYLGIPVDEHKLEMKCGAAGTNPQAMDLKKLREFVGDKLNEVAEIDDGVYRVSSEILVPEMNLSGIVSGFKLDSDFMKNTF